MSIPHYVSDLIENLDIGVFFFDEDMHIFFANRAFIEAIDLERGEIERAHPHILDIFPEIDTDALKNSEEDLLTDRGILRLLTGYEDEPFYGIGILNPQGLFQVLKLELSKIRRELVEMALVLIKLNKTENEGCADEEYEYISFLKVNLSSILRESDIIEESNLIRYGERGLLVLLFMKKRSFDDLRTVIDRIKSVADKEYGCIEGITIVGTFARKKDTIPGLLDRVNGLLKEAGPGGSIIDVEE